MFFLHITAIYSYGMNALYQRNKILRAKKQNKIIVIFEIPLNHIFLGLAMTDLKIKYAL